MFRRFIKYTFKDTYKYGYGEDAYFITDNQEELQNEFISKGAKIVRPLHKTDYNNLEFVLEDIDGRGIAFGMKYHSVVAASMYRVTLNRNNGPCK